MTRNANDNFHSRMLGFVANELLKFGDANLENCTYFSNIDNEWIVDEVFFNSSKNTMFGWVLMKSQKDWASPIHYAKFFCGEKVSDEWSVYIHNMPQMRFHRDINVECTFEEMRKAVKKDVVGSGIIGKNCQVNDKYIEGWLDRKGKDMSMLHQKFLQSGKR